jgi:hypothetical protein
MDRILAVARELASDTATASKYLNANPNHPQSFACQNESKSSVEAAGDRDQGICGVWKKIAL